LDPNVVIWLINKEKKSLLLKLVYIMVDAQNESGTWVAAGTIQLTLLLPLRRPPLPTRRFRSVHPP
jgi:hypothetical protein